MSLTNDNRYLNGTEAINGICSEAMDTAAASTTIAASTASENSAAVAQSESAAPKVFVVLLQHFIF